MCIKVSYHPKLQVSCYFYYVNDNIRNILYIHAGILQPVVNEDFGQKSYLVDGGLICNFPVHAFDGMWIG